MTQSQDRPDTVTPSSRQKELDRLLERAEARDEVSRAREAMERLNQYAPDVKSEVRTVHYATGGNE